jgi:TonB family protein
MKDIGRRLLASVCAVALAANGVGGVMAQDKTKAHGKKRDEKVGNVLTGAALVDTIYITVSDPTGGAFQFFPQEMSFDNRPIAGAPFSAEVASEMIQTLADGTRIVQRSEGRLYRDSQGRTRNERAFQIGDRSEPKQTIAIHDPVGGVSYTLDPETRSAGKMEASPKVEPPKTNNVLSGVTMGSALRKVQPPYPSIARAARVSGLVQLLILISETGEVIQADAVSGHPLLRDAAAQAARQWLFEPTEQSGRPVKILGVLNFNFAFVNEEPTSSQAARSGAKYTVKTEQLHKQIVEGIECEGERAVTTINVGAIGNDRPIETVNETWYSPDLRMMILSKRNDPRFGESTYRVTNITRAEPEAALFQAPPDYTIKEAGK